MYAKGLHHTIFIALADVVRRHPILAAIPRDEHTPTPYFARLPYIDLEQSVTVRTRLQSFRGEDEGLDEELDALLQDQANINFKTQYGSLPFWRLIVLESKDKANEFTACFVFHHAIGDGVSGVAFQSAFLEALRAASSSAASISSSQEHIIIPNDIPLLPPLEELHPLPLSDLATKPPPAALKEWTGGLIRRPCSTRFKSLCLPHDASKQFVQACKSNKLTVTAALPSLISNILLQILPSDIEALTCIIPVSLRPWLPREIVSGAIGCWFDAFKVQLRHHDHDSDSQFAASLDIWPQAQKTSKDIADCLTNTSPSGEPYTTVAIFQCIPDVSPIFLGTIGNARDAAFELSNLGVFPDARPAGDKGDNEDNTWQVGRVTFSRSAVVSGAALTIGAVTGGDGRLTLGFTWQDGVVADSVVETVITRIRRYFER